MNNNILVVLGLMALAGYLLWGATTGSLRQHRSDEIMLLSKRGRLFCLLVGSGLTAIAVYIFCYFSM